MAVAKEYISNLPSLYESDLEFRLLFDWHFSPAGRRLAPEEIHPLFAFQHHLAHELGKRYELDYQFIHFFILHAMSNLCGKTVLEIGGSLPNELLFELFGISKYINTESPDYIKAESGSAYSAKHGEHPNRTTLCVNAEDLNQSLQPESVDTIFSVACFEHIYGLESALQCCHEATKQGGLLYSFFAPIYSYIIDGDHHTIPPCEIFSPTRPWGLHLLSNKDQRSLLLSHGMSNPKEIQEFLGEVNFNRVPNRLIYEEYSRILTESPFYVIKLDEVAPNPNISKQWPREVARVRKSNPSIGNLHTQGFRVILRKS